MQAGPEAGGQCRTAGAGSLPSRTSEDISAQARLRPHPQLCSRSHAHLAHSPAHLAPSGEQPGNHEPPVKRLKGTQTQTKAARDPEFYQCPRPPLWREESGCLAAPQGGAAGSVLRVPGRRHCAAGTARNEKVTQMHPATGTCRPVAQHRVTTGGVQLQGRGCPKEIHTELINTRPAGDKCQTIGQQGALCLRDPS